MRVLSALVLGVSLFAAAPVSADHGAVIELEPIILVGDTQRPNAFYVLERSPGHAEVVDLRTSFTDEIVRDADGVDR